MAWRMAFGWVISSILVCGNLPGAPAPTDIKPMPPTTVPVLTLHGHATGVFHVCWSPDGQMLATSGRDRLVKLWNNSGQPIGTLTGHTGRVYSSAFRPDGRWLATACEDHKVRIFEVATGKLLQTLDGHTQEVYHVAFRADGKQVISTSGDSTARICDAATGKVVHALLGPNSRVLTAGFSPDGRWVATSNPNDDSQIRLWDAASGDLMRAFAAKAGGVMTIAFSPEGKRLAGACLDGKIRLWELPGGQETLVLSGHTLEAYPIAFSPDGRRLASCSGSWNNDKGGEIKLWDLTSEREIWSVALPALPLWSVAFRPDGQRLEVASGLYNKDRLGSVQIWDTPPLSELSPAKANELELLWSDLASPEAGKAYHALRRMASAPNLSVPFLRANAKPPVADDGKQIQALIAALDSEDFEEREKASLALERMGESARVALKAASGTGSAELRRRIGQLLEKPPPAMSGDALRGLRTVELLLMIGTTEARALLRHYAECAPNSTVGREAAAGVAWLARKGAS